jgi:Ca2+-binding EF-hand superfamily protein
MSEKTALLQEAFGFYDEDGTGTLHIDFLRDIVMYHGEGCPDVRIYYLLFYLMIYYYIYIYIYIFFF